MGFVGSAFLGLLHSSADFQDFQDFQDFWTSRTSTEDFLLSHGLPFTSSALQTEHESLVTLVSLVTLD
jgi:hypothetical protein